MKAHEIQTGYVRELTGWLQEIETRLNDLYGTNWKLRIERESRRIWRCHWDIASVHGVIGGGSESFTITLGED